MSDADPNAAHRLRSLAFVLPFALPSLNVTIRQHRMTRHTALGNMRLEVLAAIGGSRYIPHPPFARARVTVVRISTGMLDTDNAYAACKPLVDVLRLGSDRHPTGLGVILDDNPKCCELIVQQQTAPGLGSTAVRIEELPALPVVAKLRRKRWYPPKVRKGGITSQMLISGQAGRR